MKKAKILLLTAVAALGFTFASCSKDEVAKDVEGTYNGTMTLSMTMDGQTRELGSMDGTLVVKAESDDEVSVTLPAISGGQGMSLPEFAISGVEVDSKGNLKKNSFTASAGGFELKGSFKGTVKNGKLNATYGIQAGAMPHTIDVDFKSK